MFGNASHHSDRLLACRIVTIASLLFLGTESNWVLKTHMIVWTEGITLIIMIQQTWQSLLDGV